MLLRDYFNSLNFYKNGELSRNQIDRSGVQLKKENQKFSVVRSRSPKTLVLRRCRCLSQRHTWRFYTPIAAIGKNRQVYPVQRLQFSPIAVIGLYNRVYNRRYLACQISAIKFAGIRQVCHVQRFSTFIAANRQ